MGRQLWAGCARVCESIPISGVSSGKLCTSFAKTETVRDWSFKTSDVRSGLCLDGTRAAAGEPGAGARAGLLDGVHAPARVAVPGKPPGARSPRGRRLPPTRSPRHQALEALSFLAGRPARPPSQPGRRRHRREAGAPGAGDTAPHTCPAGPSRGRCSRARRARNSDNHSAAWQAGSRQTGTVFNGAPGSWGTGTPIPGTLGYVLSRKRPKPGRRARRGWRRGRSDRGRPPTCGAGGSGLGPDGPACFSATGRLVRPREPGSSCASWGGGGLRGGRQARSGRQRTGRRGQSAGTKDGGPSTKERARRPGAGAGRSGRGGGPAGARSGRTCVQPRPGDAEARTPQPGRALRARPVRGHRAATAPPRAPRSQPRGRRPLRGARPAERVPDPRRPRLRRPGPASGRPAGRASPLTHPPSPPAP